MIYLKLFLNFLMIGALSFGGGYGMVSLVRETVFRLYNKCWGKKNRAYIELCVGANAPTQLLLLYINLQIKGFHTINLNFYGCCSLLKSLDF